MKRIEIIRVCVLQDESPDTSYLGEYSNTPRDGAIDRKGRGDWDTRQYRYFNPTNVDPEHPEYAEADYKRMENLNKGEWSFIGIMAKAHTSVSLDGGKTWKTDFITSSGLWGIESDSGKEWLQEIANEQIEELKEILMEYGFIEETINAVPVQDENLASMYS